MTRTSISVDHTIFEGFSAQAKSRNRTLFAFANEALSATAKISQEGGDPAELYKFWRSMVILKQMDVITLPSDIVDELIATSYAKDKEALLATFSDLGRKLAGVTKIAARDLSQLSELIRDFVTLTPIKQFKVSPMDGEGGIEMAVVGAGRRIESTECSFALLNSVLEAYGYTVTRRELNVGTIVLRASRRKFA